MIWAAWEDDRGNGERIWVRSSQATDRGRTISGLGESPASYPALATGGGLVAIGYESGERRQQMTQFQLIATLHAN